MSLKELSHGVKASRILTTGPVAGSKGAPPMAAIIMPDDVSLTVQVTEKGWQIHMSLLQGDLRLLTEYNVEYAKKRQDALMQKLLAVAAEREFDE
ncbi:unnamed protein product [Rhizoctonia solani]|uniref:Uncharacterized protein n=1 Tax=Rhizoctonia solani TaxID=456999 RepID=A0A8H3HSX5_9AGAM|nr:unnamed protein product [Rhizoctonia solani]